MKRAIIIVAAVFWLLVTSGSALACSCSLPSPKKTEKQLVRAERQKSKAVFVGEVVEIIVPETVNGEPAFYADVKFKVTQSWKGTVAQQITVRTANVCCICGYTFKVGEKYLVYAYSSDSGGGLTTNICTRTKGFADAAIDLKFLGKGKNI